MPSPPTSAEQATPVAARLTVVAERWPIAGGFAIAHGRKTEAVVLVVTLESGGVVAKGECTPYPRFGESVEGVLAELESLAARAADGISHQDILDMEAHVSGAARCALDNALWDLRAKLDGVPVAALLGRNQPAPVVTAFTISVDTPAVMAERAAEHQDRALLKIKLAGDDADGTRLEAVHAAAPNARLLVDPNGSWTTEIYQALSPRLPELGVAMLEQPFSDDDQLLAQAPRTVPVAADEACRNLSTIASLRDRYDLINIKLDKAGGLTSGLRWAAEAATAGMGFMVGCHVCTSLSLAPALLLAGDAMFVDLDAGLLLERDREGGLVYEGSTVGAGSLWG